MLKSLNEGIKQSIYFLQIYLLLKKTAAEIFAPTVFIKDKYQSLLQTLLR